MHCMHHVLFLLQMLQQSHSGLTQLLGKTSGRDVDKLAELKRLGFSIGEEYGLPIISGTNVRGESTVHVPYGTAGGLQASAMHCM